MTFNLLQEKRIPLEKNYVENYQEMNKINLIDL